MLESLFLREYGERDFIERNKAKVFLYYSILLLFLLPFIPVGYLFLRLPRELTMKGAAGAAGIAGLVLISLACLRTGKLRLAVMAYALPIIILISAVRIYNAIESPETAFTAYIFYMLYLIVYLAAFGRRRHVVGATCFFLLQNFLVYYLVRKSEGPIASAATTGVVNGSLGMAITGIVSYQLIRITETYVARLREEASSQAEKIARVEELMAKLRGGLDVGGSLVG